MRPLVGVIKMSLNNNVFDELLNDENQDKVEQNQKPLWAIDLDKKNSEESILKWLRADLADLKERSIEELFEIRENRALYKGLNLPERVQFNKARSEHPPFVRSRRKHIKINHLYDLTEQKVSRLVKFKPQVAITPFNGKEFEDKTASKVNKMLWDHISESEKFDKKSRTVVRASKIDGEGYLLIKWDDAAGLPRKDQAKIRELTGEDIPLVDSQGKVEEDDAGNPIRIKRIIKQGDVTHEVIFRNNIFFQRATKFEDIEYCYIERVDDTEVLKLKYPKMAKEIKATKNVRVMDPTTNEEVMVSGKTVYYEFYYKNTIGMPEGREIIWTDGVMLFNRKLRYTHGELPLERLPDIEIPGEAHAQSFYRNTKRIQETHDKLSSQILRNQALVAHPKWFVPRGSVKLESLGNDITIVQYQGSQPPVLGQQNPTPSEVFGFRRELVEDMQQISGVFGTSRGTPPPGIKAGVALQFLSEQENERANSEIANYNDWIKRVSRKTLITASDNYKKDDERTLNVLGPANEWMTFIFDPKHLKRFADRFNVNIQNSSALGNSKAQQIQTVLDLNEVFPDIVPREQVLDMVDFGTSAKFFDATTGAVQRAEAENQLILDDGKEVPPQRWEYQIEHWQVHVQEMQGPGFPFVKKSHQTIMIDHIRAHEMFMFELAKINPQFQEKMLALKQFPLLYTPETAAPPAEPVTQEITDEELEIQALAGAVPQTPVVKDTASQANPPVENLQVQGAQRVAPTQTI